MEAHIITTLINKLLVFSSSTKSKAATFWIQYMKMAEIGHYHYQQSVYLYLQTMSQIHVTYLGLHKHFMNGLHVIHRSDRFWADLSQDLVIQQVLMRSLKKSAGLTRGRGMSERQQAIWLLSMPLTAGANRTMQDFTGTKYQISDQHKDTGQAQITRDH